MNGLIACPEWSGEPMQHVSYITCHDNYCLRDRIEVSAKEETEATKLRMNKLAQTAVLVSQGMTFIYGGEELYRTKRGIDNSYQSPDSINIIPWENKEKYADLFEYYKQMIAIRRAHKAFRLGSAEAVKDQVCFVPCDNPHVIIYCTDKLVVFLNGGAEKVEFVMPEYEGYTILAYDAQAKADGLGVLESAKVTVEPYSATILAEN